MADGRANLEAVPQEVDRPSDDEQPKPQAVGLVRIQPVKGIEHPCKLVWRDPDTGIVNLDTHP